MRFFLCFLRNLAILFAYFNYITIKFTDTIQYIETQ